MPSVREDTDTSTLPEPARFGAEFASNHRRILEAVVEMTPECIKIVAPDGRLLLMNTAGLKMIGADSWARVDGTSAFDLVAPEHRNYWREQHERVCRGEPLAWEFDLVGLDGERRHMETNAVPIDLDDGTVGQLAITRDVTARKNAESTLHDVLRERTLELERALARLGETERSFERLVDSVTDYALFMLDTTGRIVSWNSGAQRIKGYAADRDHRPAFFRFLHQRRSRSARPARAASKPRHAKAASRRKAGACARTAPASGPTSSSMRSAIAASSSASPRSRATSPNAKRPKCVLREAQKMEAVGQFTGGAAHDFNNLLMAILGSLELLRKRLPDDRNMHALLDTAMQGARRGATLTQRMLAFARRQELKREAVDLCSLVGGMKEFLAHSMGARIDVAIDISRQLPRVSTDANQLESALQNLALNARDAMSGGGQILISAHEELVDAGHATNLSPGEYVCISVADAGEGMDEATLARATQPFFTTKGVGKGTGLGLSMVDGLAAQSGGRLIVHSQPGHGTTVEIWLPIAEAGLHANHEQHAAGTDVPRAAANPLVVLAVDDDSLVLINIAAMLEDLGHTVIDVGSGAKALEIINAGTRVDLVISDQAMPGMTGVQLFDAIRARRPHLPLVLATGYAELPPGIDTYRLAKPFTQSELAEAVAAAVR